MILAHPASRVALMLGRISVVHGIQSQASAHVKYACANVQLHTHKVTPQRSLWNLCNFKKPGILIPSSIPPPPRTGEPANFMNLLSRRPMGGCLLPLMANATANNNKVRDEVTEPLVMEHTASAIVRSAGLLPAPARQAMQKQFGNSTEVTLPNGDRINTRQLGASRVNLHTNNNRLGASTSTVGQYLPGMQNHQQPDLSNPTQNFMTAARSSAAFCCQCISWPILCYCICCGYSSEYASFLCRRCHCGRNAGRKPTSDE